jgi:PAS domain S-box-containing protein
VIVRVHKSKGQKSASSWRRLFRRYGTPLRIGLVGLVLSLTAFFVVGHWEARWRTFDFERLAEARCNAFKSEATHHLHELAALKRFYEGSQFVSRDEFVQFVEPLLEIHSDIHAIGWAPRVIDTNRDTFRQTVRAEGLANYQIRENPPVDDATVTAPRNEYYPMLYHLPRFDWAMGWDLLSEPLRREAVEQARDMDRPAVTEPVVFPGKRKDRLGVIAFQPVYKKGLPTMTVEERRAAIEGVVMAALNVDDILAGILLKLEPGGIDILVSDVSTPEDKQFLCRHWSRLGREHIDDSGPKVNHGSDLLYVAIFEMADRTWELRCTPSLADNVSHTSWTHWITLLSGLALTILLMAYLRAKQNRTAIIEALMDERTAQLRESKERLDLALRGANLGVWDWNLQTDEVNFNERWAEILGYRLDEIEPHLRSWEKLVHPDDMARVEKILNEHLEGQTPFYVAEYRLRHKSGEWIWVLDSGRVIERDIEGRPLRACGTHLDITERKQAEDALRLQSMIIENMSEGVFLIRHTDGVITYTNWKCEQMFGYDPGEMIGKHVSTVNYPTTINVEETARKIMESISENGEWQGEVHNIKKDGTPFWCYASISMFDHPDYGRVLVSIHTDITERKWAEEALKESQEELRQVQKMEAIGRLAGGVAHDFNNLLAIITGNSELLNLRLDSDDPRHKHVEEISQAGERAADLTRQLLAFSRKQVLAPKVLDLNSIVTDMGKMLRRLIGEDIELVVRLDPTIGSIKADPGQVEQVIMNLVVNGRDAMPNGGIITVGTGNIDLDEDFVCEHPDAVRGPHVLLVVSDTGNGMDEHTQSRIFEPFFTTKEQGKGTGLGLSTVFGIVKQSDGHIVVYSVPGFGTTFNIFLPRVDNPVEHSGSKTTQLDIFGDTGTILLAEDEKGLRDLISVALQAQGYTVIPAKDGTEALALAERDTRPIHLLLTDIVMPKMSGLDLAQHLARIRPITKVILMSGYTDDKIADYGKLDSTTVFLQKPFNLGVLTNTVRTILAASPSEIRQPS